MNDTAEFLAAFGEAVKAAGGRPRSSPAALVDEWLGFVQACEQGYSEDIDEFHNDRSVRGLLEQLLNDPGLGRFPQLSWVRTAVAAADERYRAVLIPVDMWPHQTWWERSLPRLAGEELAAEFLEQYGVAVEIVE
ncbi:hypothetical protein [Kribbella endophytica]